MLTNHNKYNLPVRAPQKCAFLGCDSKAGCILESPVKLLKGADALTSTQVNEIWIFALISRYCLGKKKKQNSPVDSNFHPALRTPLQGIDLNEYVHKYTYYILEDVEGSQAILIPVSEFWLWKALPLLRLWETNTHTHIKFTHQYLFVRTMCQAFFRAEIYQCTQETNSPALVEFSVLLSYLRKTAGNIICFFWHKAKEGQGRQQLYIYEVVKDEGCSMRN